MVRPKVQIKFEKCKVNWLICGHCKFHLFFNFMEVARAAKNSIAGRVFETPDLRCGYEVSEEATKCAKYPCFSQLKAILKI